MSKQQFESNVKPIPYAQSCVYAKLADLNNLAVIKDGHDARREARSRRTGS